MSDIGKTSHRHLTRHSLVAISLTLVFGMLASACDASERGLIPVSGDPHPQIHVTEYALVEQSSDNPTHPAFIEHVPETGIARRLAQPETALEIPNQTLLPFGYRLTLDIAAPFQSYALYQGDMLVQDDILHFWPVTLNAAGDDFLLPFETLAGERQVASRSGINLWPGAEQQQTSAPVFIGDRLAYAAVSDSQISVQAGGQVLFSQPDPPAAYAALPGAAVPGRLSTWDGHWALEVDGRVIVDGIDLNASLEAEHIFLWHTLGGQPLFMFVKDGLTRVNYAGHTLPYVYDAIVAGDTPETALFRPGSSADSVWFFALRDGLWYYVEASLTAE